MNKYTLLVETLTQMLYTRIVETQDDYGNTSVLDDIIDTVRDMYNKVERADKDTQREALKEMISVVLTKIENSKIREENKKQIKWDLNVKDNLQSPAKTLTGFIFYVYNSLLKKSGLGITPKKTKK